MSDYSLPTAFKERTKQLLGEEYQSFENQILNGSPTQSFFVQLTLPDSFLQSVNAEKISYAHNGYYFSADKIGSSPLHHAGAFYVQDPSAMCTVCAPINIPQGVKILDMCASPGGKTLFAALKAGKDSFVVSNEYNVSRCKTLVGNVERIGVENVVVLNCDAADDSTLCDTYGSFFDLIICDTPCSGEGMFRKYPEQAIGEWSEENVKLCASRQKKILDNAAKCLNAGGLIVYSTCTFSLEENEMLVDNFLCEHTDFHIERVADEVINATADGYLFDGCKNADITKTRRFYPHISKGEGQFIALLRKDGTAIEQAYEFDKPAKKQKSKGKSKPQETGYISPTNEDIQAVNDFFCGLVTNFDISRVKKYGDNLIYTHKNAKLPSRHVFSGGVKLGEVSKGRLVPHHQLFKVFGRDFLRRVELSYTDERCVKYLRGESIYADIQDGWCAVCVDGYVLGGAKVVDGEVKNHYPKGLRIN